MTSLIVSNYSMYQSVGKNSSWNLTLSYLGFVAYHVHQPLIEPFEQFMMSLEPDTSTFVNKFQQAFRNGDFETQDVGQSREENAASFCLATLKLTHEVQVTYTKYKPVIDVLKSVDVTGVFEQLIEESYNIHQRAEMADLDVPYEFTVPSIRLFEVKGQPYVHVRLPFAFSENENRSVQSLDYAIRMVANGWREMAQLRVAPHTPHSVRRVNRVSYENPTWNPSKAISF